MNQALSSLSPKKRAFLTGTLLLTGTGFLCRILGFFYRIFMSRTIGAEGLGIYNMIHPVFGICFAVCAGSIQTALSQHVAADQKRGRPAFLTGLSISLALSLMLAVGIWKGSDFIASCFLLEPRCAPYLLIIALSVPFAALHACINGYYYGMQRSSVPAFSQVAEQIVRMGAVFLIVQAMTLKGRPITVSLAVYGHLIGEAASAAFTLLCLLLWPPDGNRGRAGRTQLAKADGAARRTRLDGNVGTDTKVARRAQLNGNSRTVRRTQLDQADGAARRARLDGNGGAAGRTQLDQAGGSDRTSQLDGGRMKKERRAHKGAGMLGEGTFSDVLPLLALALPLMGNRLILNLLASAEAIWIPNRLIMYGLSDRDAFSVYGVLTGMAMPFILFPSAITNSIAVLLLPTVAQAQAEKKTEQISASVSMALRYSLYMGICCTGVFCLYGRELGTSVFHDPSAGAYIRVLGWLCPFMYLATTLGSILNGLGKTSSTFLQNVCALALRLVFVLLGIPRLGMKAYLWGILVSEIFLAMWHLLTLHGYIPFVWDGLEMIGKPVLLITFSGIVDQKLWQLLMPFLRPLSLEPGRSLSFIGIGLKICSLCAIYGLCLLLWHLLSRGRSGQKCADPY